MDPIIGIITICNLLLFLFYSRHINLQRLSNLPKSREILETDELKELSKEMIEKLNIVIYPCKCDIMDNPHYHINDSTVVLWEVFVKEVLEMNKGPISMSSHTCNVV